jgi:hypothetical protein
MKFGAWIHERDLSLDEQILIARQSGLQSIRSYSLDYSRRAVPALKQNGMSLLAGMHIEGESLVADWRQQVNFEELGEITKLGVELEGICVGNELREGGDAADRKQFTARLSFGLANVLNTYRHWLDEHDISVPLTYAMEGIVFDGHGTFHEWLWRSSMPAILSRSTCIPWASRNGSPLGLSQRAEGSHGSPGAQRPLEPVRIATAPGADSTGTSINPCCSETGFLRDWLSDGRQHRSSSKRQ